MRAMARYLAKAGLMLALVIGCVVLGRMVSVGWTLYHLKLERVPNDVAHAIATGDVRLLAIEGQALFIPGVDDALYTTATNGHCGIRVIHVGDAFYFDWQERLYFASFDYANAFNRQLVSRIPRSRLCDPAV